MMDANKESEKSICTVYWLIALTLCLLMLLPACSSRQSTRVNSLSPSTETTVAELEETPLELPEEIMPPAVEEKDEVAEKANRLVNPEVKDPKPEELQLSVGPNGDVFASSGKASSPTSVTIPQSNPIPALAKPKDLRNLPFTLSDIFFDYDQYTLHERDIKILETNAEVILGRYSNKKILIQGHCDERGTEEYNIALGVRRAQAVKDYLVDLGVPSENVGVLSYGKEKPFCTQHSWTCWKHNRRSHFVFQ